MRKSHDEPNLIIEHIIVMEEILGMSIYFFHCKLMTFSLPIFFISQYFTVLFIHRIQYENLLLTN